MKARAAQALARAAVVVATESRLLTITRFAAIVVAISAQPVSAAVLPEDRSDLMYHYYDGGGVEVKGPALLVRKSLLDKFSVNASYYVDSVSSASVDVVTTASPFRETRTEYRGGVDYLDGNSIVGFAVSRSEEPDYYADSASFNVSHELFGGMTTTSLGYTHGSDDVLRSDSSFQDKIERHQYRIGVTQVLTKSLLVGLNYEGTAEEGYLSSPYRSARVLGAYVPERYPRTRNGHALALRGLLALSEADGKPTSSIGISARLFRDSWQLNSSDTEVVYRRRLPRNWTLEALFRFYSQDAASFYSDNFSGEFEYMARDKELSTFQSYTLGAKASWTFCGGPSADWRCALSFSFNRISFEYDNFTDVRTGSPLSFDADVAHVFLSLWY